MKNLTNLGTALNRKEQKEVFGGDRGKTGTGGWINPSDCNQGIYVPCPAYHTRIFNPGNGECECVYTG